VLSAQAGLSIRRRETFCQGASGGVGWRLRVKRLLLCFLFLVPLAYGMEGQVFIASKGGHVVKLPSVTLRAYDAAEYKALMAHSAAVKKKYEKMGNRLAELLDDFRENGTANIPEDERTRLAEQNTAEVKTLTSELETFVPSFLVGLPLKLVAQATTDAEGHYTLPLKDRSHLVIVAVADRQIFNSTEHYWWVVFDPPEELNLTNQALTTKMPWDPDLFRTK
jgi:hypothetical protein